MNDDIELLDRFIAGDQEAFNALMRAHEDRVFAISLRMMRSREAALDATQETFLTLYRKADRFHRQSAFSTWLHGIGLNVVRRRWRSERSTQKAHARLSLVREVEAETDDALSRTGKDVGTPIIHFEPPDGVAFFGPVISRLPTDEQAVELWDHVVALAGFPGFAEMKRSLRELPQLRGLGVEPGDVGVEQDWHGGSRRLKK